MSLLNPVEPQSVRLVHLIFDLPIYARQIPQWRGAFIEMAGLDYDLLHNHQGEGGFLYRYPKVQYRMYRGKAAILGINEGADTLQQVLSERNWKIRWQGTEVQLNLADWKMQEKSLRMLPYQAQYKLHKWLPLNAGNYQAWKECPSLLDRVELLDRILASNLIALAKGLNWHLPERLEVHLQNLKQIEDVKCFGNPMLAFNVNYAANISLPPHIGIGKAVSHGFGWQVPAMGRKENRAIKHRHDEASGVNFKAG